MLAGLFAIADVPGVGVFMPKRATSNGHRWNKPKYHVTNWPEYDRALRRRGDVTVWMSDAAIAGWLKSDRPTAGGKPVYTDLAIEMVLTIRTIFHLPLRQAEGFVASLFTLMGIALPVPDHTTVSRRGPGLQVKLPSVSSDGPVEILVDSTGLRIVEARKHRRGRSAPSDGNRRQWLKLHLAFETGTGHFVAARVTGCHRHDAAALPDLLGEIDGRIDCLLGDGAYGGSPTYDALIERVQCLPSPVVVAPPTSPERVPPDTLDLLRQRDRHIAFIQEHGKRAWQANTGYHRRSHIENGNARYKRIIGRRVRTRSLPAQNTEAAIGVTALNRMFDLGRPITRRVG